MKRNIYIFTDNFPYGSAEKSFLLPEIGILQENYNIAIISGARESERAKKELETSLAPEIKVFHHSKEDVNGFEVCKYIFSFLLFNGTRQEIKNIFLSRKNIIGRVEKSLYFFARAKKFKDWLEKESIIDKNDKGVIYSYWYNHRVLGFQMMRKEYPYLKILTRAHGYDLYKERREYSWQPYKTVMDTVLDKIIFISEHGLKYYLQNFNMNEHKMKKYEICKIGVGAQRTCINHQRHVPFLLVSCSSVIPLKRVEMIIDALAEINEFDVKWVHFGDGLKFDEVRKRAQLKLGDKKNIKYEFKGYMDNRQILLYYAEEMPDCFITVSSTEGSPVSVQEALAFGTPMIGTAVGGIPEMINGNGILLDGNPLIENIVSAINEIVFLDDAKYYDMRKKSYQIWKEDYNQTENIKRFMEILDNL
ncbi:glycosyltransferase [Lachnospiraceae bacterium 54-11]